MFLASSLGDTEEADRLTLASPEGYPGELATSCAVNMLGGRVLLQCGTCLRHNGRGEPDCMLRCVIHSDLAGHRGEHFVVCRSWLGTAGTSTADISYEEPSSAGLPLDVSEKDFDAGTCIGANQLNAELARRSPGTE